MQLQLSLPAGTILHTSHGQVLVKLYSMECPFTVQNFVTHVMSGYYDGIIFHRIIKGFIIQVHIRMMTLCKVGMEKPHARMWYTEVNILSALSYADW